MASTSRALAARVNRSAPSAAACAPRIGPACSMSSSRARSYSGRRSSLGGASGAGSPTRPRPLAGARRQLTRPGSMGPTGILWPRTKQPRVRSATSIDPRGQRILLLADTRRSRSASRRALGCDARAWRRAGRAPSSKRDLHSSSRMTPVGGLLHTRARGGQPKRSWTRTSEVCAQELAGAGQGGVAFVEHRGESLEHVRDARCDFERDGDIGRRGTRGEPGRVVEEDLV